MIAMLAEMRTLVAQTRALNEALKVHSLLLEQHAKLMQQIAGAGTPAGQGVLDYLGQAFSHLVGELPPEDPPPPRRRRR